MLHSKIYEILIEKKPLDLDNYFYVCTLARWFFNIDNLDNLDNLYFFRPITAQAKTNSIAPPGKRLLVSN